jgi:hypothetical protein
MSKIVEKMTDFWRSLEARGTVYLCALMQQEDQINKWDLVVSSAWTDSHAREANQYLSNELSTRLEREDYAELARLVVLPSRAPFVAAITSTFRVEDGKAELINFGINGLAIRRAFLFRSMPAPGVAPGSAVPVAAQATLGAEP